MSILPPMRPRAPRSLVEARAGIMWKAEQFAMPLHDPTVVIVRGYYRDTMGAPGRNDRGLYDDAAFILTPETFAAFNANADPSIYRAGVATVREGVHWFRPGWHRRGQPGGHQAFRPATAGERLPVYRDGETNPAPGIATNLHMGGRTTTSSLGCLTIPPDQWPAFHALLTSELRRAGSSRFPVILLNGPII